MNKWQQMAAVAVLLGAPLLATATAWAGETDSVVLRLKDSGFEFSGSLKSFDGSRYVVAAPSVGLLSIDAERFDCEGDACAKSTVATAASSTASTFAIEANGANNHQVFAIDGSATIGLELMPQLIRDYAHSLGGSAKQVIGGATNAAVQFRITDARGAEISSIDLKRRNSADAFGSLLAGRAAIGMSSRPISAAEAATMPPVPGGIHGPEGEVVLALDALAVLVAPDNPAKSVSIEALAKIAAGKITNWSELGLPPANIKLYVGSPDSGANEGFDEIVMRPRGLALTTAATHMKTEAELSDAVARDPYGIGVTSLAFLRNAKALAVADACGRATAPSVFAVKSEEYPLGRRLYLYTAGLAPNSVARELLAFASSAPAQISVQNSQFIDQSIEQIAFNGESRRFDLAIKNAGLKREQAQARAIAQELKGATRLSTTLRFASGSSQLDAKARDDVARLRDFLRRPELTGKTVLFVGYTDSIGTPSANIDLSYRRAVQIRDAVTGDRPSGKIPVVLGEGPIAPVACDETGEGQRLNRRVEVWLRD